MAPNDDPSTDPSTFQTGRSTGSGCSARASWPRDDVGGGRRTLCVTNVAGSFGSSTLGVRTSVARWERGRSSRAGTSSMNIAVFAAMTGKGLWLPRGRDSRGHDDDAGIPGAGAAPRSGDPAGPVRDRRLPSPHRRTHDRRGAGPWQLTVTGGVASKTYDWDGLHAVGVEDITVDIHCITHWTSSAPRGPGFPVGRCSMTPALVTRKTRCALTVVLH